jgi:glycosyltransferase involved in cell wall biosynthesis
VKEAPRIALVSPRYPPAFGGVERHVEMLARGLAQRGIDVEVITTDPDRALPKEESLDGVVVRRFPTIARDATYFLAPQLAGWLLVHGRRYAAIHAHSYHTPLALVAAVAARRAQVPFIVTPHYHGTGHSPFRRALHYPYRLAGGWLVRRAERVICVSQEERRVLETHFGSRLKTVVHPNGVDSAEISAARPYDKPPGEVLILSVGRLEAYKEVGRLVATLTQLPWQYRLAIIGDGPERERIERVARELNIIGRVRLLGQVSRDELVRWYRTADVYISLSRHEAFGLTLLEAAVAGLAVVASDLPAHREVATNLRSGQVSFVSTTCSPVELAQAVQDAALRGRRPSLAAKSLPGWSETVDGALSCYQAVLGHDLSPEGAMSRSEN